jgi:hypothetical protein
VSLETDHLQSSQGEKNDKRIKGNEKRPMGLPNTMEKGNVQILDVVKKKLYTERDSKII